MAEVTNPGEDKAWALLSTLNPEEVCKSAAVLYDAASLSYIIRSFGMDFSISVRDRVITSTAPGSEVFLQKLGYFFRLAVLWYMVYSKNFPCTGRLVKLDSIKGGDIFTKGSHVLPLDKIAEKYGKDRKTFLKKGESLDCKPMKFGDVSIQLSPLPNVPVVLLLWLEDEEFPARADLLFDSTCDLQLPTDILWSIAMMSVLAML